MNFCPNSVGDMRSFTTHPVTVDKQEQKIMDMEEIMKLCIQTEENYPGFRKFGFFQLVDATDGFSENRNVGIGGFGTVYKVMNVYTPCLPKI